MCIKVDCLDGAVGEIQKAREYNHIIQMLIQRVQPGEVRKQSDSVEHLKK